MAHHHHHHHSNEKCCNAHECCGCDETCEVCHHHHHQGHEHEDFAHELIEMADEAWMEVLREKIKEQIEALNGKQLDKLAKIIAEANNARWKHKMGGQKVSEAFKEKIHQFFEQ